jgi:hypothetical protein
VLYKNLRINFVRLTDPTNDYRSQGLTISITAANNMLVDPHTLQLTALLDFDFAYIGSTLDESCSFMPELYGRLPGPIEAKTDSSLQAIRQAILRDAWDVPSFQLDHAMEKRWKLSKMWHNALVVTGVESPGTTERSLGFSSVIELSKMLCPSIICNDIIASSRSKKAREADIQEAQARLILALKG